MLHKIAARLGKFVSEVEAECDYEEVLEWSRFFEAELRLYDKQDYYMAQLTQAVIAPHIPKGKRTKINDYLIKFGKKEQIKKLTGQEMKNIMQGFLKNG